MATGGGIPLNVPTAYTDTVHGTLSMSILPGDPYVIVADILISRHVFSMRTFCSNLPIHFVTVRSARVRTMPKTLQKYGGVAR